MTGCMCIYMERYQNILRAGCKIVLKLLNKPWGKWGRGKHYNGVRFRRGPLALLGSGR